jgi:hypothetical protein
MIPKRIIQVWGGGKPMPLTGKASVANVRLLHPDFEYVFFDDHAIERFITDECQEYRDVLEGFEFPIQRYDFLRYLIAYRIGGFYFDLDVFLAYRISELTAFQCVFPFERLTSSDYLRREYGIDWEIGNYGFGAIPEHPFLKAIIDNCVKAQADRIWAEATIRSLPRLLRKDLMVVFTTGPGLVTRTLADSREAAKEVEVLFPDDVCDKANCWNLFGKYGVHLGNGNWRREQGFLQTRLVHLLGRRMEERAISYGRALGKLRSLDPSRSTTMADA